MVGCLVTGLPVPPSRYWDSHEARVLTPQPKTLSELQGWAGTHTKMGLRASQGDLQPALTHTPHRRRPEVPQGPRTSPWAQVCDQCSLCCLETQVRPRPVGSLRQSESGIPPHSWSHPCQTGGEPSGPGRQGTLAREECAAHSTPRWGWRTCPTWNWALKTPWSLGPDSLHFCAVPGRKQALLERPREIRR